MSDHPKADYEALIDSASHYIVGHAAASGLTIEPPVWDQGSTELLTGTHTVQIRLGNAVEVLEVQHEWLPPLSLGHGRFKTSVEAALSRLKSAATEGGVQSR